MPFLPGSRTTRNLLKVASLGLAGLLAGLLSGCNSSPALSASSHPRSGSADTSSTWSSEDFSELPQSLDARQIPALRHPPSARRLYYGSVPNSHPQLLSVGHDRS